MMPPSIPPMASLRGSGNTSSPLDSTPVAVWLDTNVAFNNEVRAWLLELLDANMATTASDLYGWSDQDFRNIGFTDVMALQQLMQAIRASAAVTPMRH
jgi:hypothetical protein